LARAGGDSALTEQYAAELVALAPDLLLGIGTPSVAALRRHTAAIPILFAIVTDPVGQGIVASLARPGGNITGFTDFDGPMAGKWLGMMAQIAPPAEHVSIIYNPANAPFADMMMRVIEGFAPPLGMTVRAAPVRDEAGVAAMMATVSPEKHDGLLVLPDGFTIVHRAVIVASAARSRVPAVYWNHVFVADGGLMSYGADNADLFQRAAAYVDRILKGAKPNDLPVQNPTKYELAINLKTAAALGLQSPPTLLAAADEVIE